MKASRVKLGEQLVSNLTLRRRLGLRTSGVTLGQEKRLAELLECAGPWVSCLTVSNRVVRGVLWCREA